MNPRDTIARKFALGDRVTKTKGSSWTGKVVGFYSTDLTPVGYAVESENEPGSVQIYPEAALTAAGYRIVGPADMEKAVAAACTEHWTGWGEWSEFRKDKEREVMRAALTAAWPHMPVPAGLSEWHGWDESRLPWSASKHKDAVCEAVFRQPWSVEDAEALIGFIERTWPRAAAHKPAALTQEPKPAEGEK